MLANNTCAYVRGCTRVCRRGGKRSTRDCKGGEERTCGSNLVVLLSGSGGESVGQGLHTVWIVSEAARVRLP